MLFDPVIRALIPPGAWWIFLSGLDDLLIDTWFACLRTSGRDAWKDSLRHLSQLPEKKIAMFVPCWHEHQVIEGMIDHNIAAIDYADYDIFLGVYPNDPRTLEQACLLEDRYPRVHKSICPEDGPTNKADCLNWIFQRMTLQEEATGTRYQVIVQHDAEDIVHPKAFKLINRLADEYDMVQIPVFPLEMPWPHFTHGTYCDEFAEYQVKDIFTRQVAGKSST
jgi:adsorption protein B